MQHDKVQLVQCNWYSATGTVQMTRAPKCYTNNIYYKSWVRVCENVPEYARIYRNVQKHFKNTHVVGFIQQLECH
jgi:hypothetical protein